MAFTAFQAYEYIEASFRTSDGVYGPTPYMATGPHGFHVTIGTISPSVALFRLAKNHSPKRHHFGSEAAAWYWHLVGATVRVSKEVPWCSLAPGASGVWCKAVRLTQRARAWGGAFGTTRLRLAQAY